MLQVVAKLPVELYLSMQSLIRFHKTGVSPPDNNRIHNKRAAGSELAALQIFYSIDNPTVSPLSGRPSLYCCPEVDAQ